MKYGYKRNALHFRITDQLFGTAWNSPGCETKSKKYGLKPLYKVLNKGLEVALGIHVQ